MNGSKIAVVIPAFRVRGQIGAVLAKMESNDLGQIIVVDDKCPEQSGRWVVENVSDPRVSVIFNEENLGVGGATMAGFTKAINSGAQIIVKVDGDGQMNPDLIPALIAPIVCGQADFVKGNRFFFLSNSRQMPKGRLFGNLVLSFLAKMSTGYWGIMDPTNGFLAVHADVASRIPFERVAKRYFFESDLLFHLGLLRAKVVDFPMMAKYGDEKSSLNITSIVMPFLKGHIRNTLLRIRYRYFIRDFSAASLELVLGIPVFAFGVLFGAVTWVRVLSTGVPAHTGTIMISVLTIFMGFQLLLAFVNSDVTSAPRDPIYPVLRALPKLAEG